MGWRCSGFRSSRHSSLDRAAEHESGNRRTKRSKKPPRWAVEPEARVNGPSESKRQYQEGSETLSGICQKMVNLCVQMRRNLSAASGGRSAS